MPLLLDDFSTSDGAAWRLFTDQVMGGVSMGQAAIAEVQGRRALRLTGTVSLERNGGFVQVARPLARNGQASFDATAFAGLAVQACGAPGRYFVHLRTTDTRAPWQYYAAPLAVTAGWTDLVIPWPAFVHKALSTPLDVTRLLRIGVVAAGAAFEADVAVASVAFVP